MAQEDRSAVDKEFHPFDILDLYAAMWLLEKRSESLGALAVLKRIVYKLELLLDVDADTMEEFREVYFK